LSLAPLAATIEAMEQKTAAREYSYRKKERFQVPLGVGLAALTLGLLLPPPQLRRGRKALVRGAAAALFLLAAANGRAESKLADELLLRPTRLTADGLREYAEGNHPKALEAFQHAAQTRPHDPRARFNLAGALYKNGKFDEAGALFDALGGEARSPLAAAARYNMGNARFEKQDYAGAVQAYKDALRLRPGDADAQHNLELALRALQEQQQQQQRQNSQPDQKPSPPPEGQQKQQQAPDGRRPERAKNPQDEERERFEKETGMPRERAMQLLDALQQNEKAEQRKLRAARPKDAKRVKDW
jgi:tetratricopeptide (TPR) repeat protein